MTDRFNGDDETNIEGIAAEFAASFPFEDPDACVAILKLLPIVVEALLAFRADRHRAHNEKMAREQSG